MRKNHYDFIKIYFCSYAAIGMLFPLIGQYLDSIGFTGAQIGMVTAACTAVGIGASPAWGCIYHNYRNGRRIILILCIASAITALGLLQVKQFLIFLIGYGIFAFFQTPIMPLNDTLVLEDRAPFGAIRKWGAIGYAGGVFLAGQIADATSLRMILPLCAGAFILTGFFTYETMRKERKQMNSHIRNGSKESLTNPARASKLKKNNGLTNKRIAWQRCNQNGLDRKSKGFKDLIANKRFAALLLSAFFINGTNIANNTYFGFLYTSSGGSLAGIGLAFLLMCGSEAPFMAWSSRISGKVTLERAILAAMIISMGRYLWYSTGPSSALLLGTFFLQGIVNGIVLVEFVRYIAKLVEPAVIGLAMTLFQSLSTNCSTIICQLFGGAILEKFSSTGVYLFFALFNIIGIFLYIGFGLHKESA